MLTDNPRARQSVATLADIVQPDHAAGSPAGADVRRQLHQLQKLAALGTVSAMLAHEFNNLLTPIVGYCQRALQATDPAAMRSFLAKSLEHARRAAELCQKFLGAAADDRSPAARTALRPLVEDGLMSLGRDLKKDGIDVAIDINPRLTAYVHAAAIRQVLFNLLLNARQAMLGRPGRLVVSAERVDGRVRMRVADDGPGIEPAHLQRVFQPFFTTKAHADRPDRRGLGLGLAVCRQLLEENGGEITVESRHGHGATFTLWLPGGD